MFEPLFTPLFSSLLSPLIAQPIPITQMDFISNLILQRGIGPPTYTRPTIGTFDDVSTELNTTAAIDEARFEVNGLLTEGESTNRIVRSEESGHAAWIVTDLSRASDTTISPDGATTADDILPNDLATGFLISQEEPVTINNIATQSIFLLSGTQNLAQLTFGGAGYGSSQYADFNLLTGDETASAGGNATIDSAANGFFRCTFAATATASSASSGALIVTVPDSATSTRLVTTTGDGSAMLKLWGGQNEPLPFASSYIKTLGSPVTRGEDTLSYDAANIPAPTENYTVSMEVDILGLDSTKTQTVYNVDGETSRKIEINTTTGLVEATHGAVTSTSTTALVPGVKTKIAFTVGAVNQTLYINGVQEDQDVKGTVTGTATALAICNAAGLNQLFGHSKFNKIFDKELTADEVKNL